MCSHCEKWGGSAATCSGQDARGPTWRTSLSVTLKLEAVLSDGHLPLEKKQPKGDLAMRHNHQSPFPLASTPGDPRCLLEKPSAEQQDAFPGQCYFNCRNGADIKDYLQAVVSINARQGSHNWSAEH